MNSLRLLLLSASLFALSPAPAPGQSRQHTHLQPLNPSQTVRVLRLTRRSLDSLQREYDELARFYFTAQVQLAKLRELQFQQEQNPRPAEKPRRGKRHPAKPPETTL